MRGGPGRECHFVGDAIGYAVRVANPGDYATLNPTTFATAPRGWRPPNTSTVRTTPVSPAIVNQLLDIAFAAPSRSDFQQATVISVVDATKRASIAARPTIDRENAGGFCVEKPRDWWVLKGVGFDRVTGSS